MGSPLNSVRCAFRQYRFGSITALILDLTAATINRRIKGIRLQARPDAGLIPASKSFCAGMSINNPGLGTRKWAQVKFCYMVSSTKLLCEAELGCNPRTSMAEYLLATTLALFQTL